MNNEPTIHRLAVGKPKKLSYGAGKTMETGIGKTSVKEAYLLKEGFENDGVADKKNHGGLERAVCFYPYEHYDKWEKELGKPLPLPAFGENITISNMLEKDVYIGDIYQVGQTVIQITQGRVPCSTIDRYVEANTLLKRVIETGLTGYLAKVIEEGKIEDTSMIKLIQRNKESISILACNKTYFENKDLKAMYKILSVDALSLEWKNRIEKRIRHLERPARNNN
ncbi:hypothetical protein JCM19046_614 [Bacillus sp. JCM 19046]|nr:hypothetical protein JCM19045_1042 [Bacillus sp. JCM 19045]GAF16199.1 hypothetical protein JCM19046_614 [Bacillus sp. JCM 19046]